MKEFMYCFQISKLITFEVIAARAVNRWRNATQWARLIPDTMQDQIRRFIFGEPEAPNSTCKYCGVWQA